MALGALILTTGVQQAGDITSLSVPAGSISVGQRMIAAFQRVGVEQIWLVTGPENRKAERLFVGKDVYFLHQEPAARTMEEAAVFGLSRLPDRIDRVFVAVSDAPLFLPETLQTLLQQAEPLVRPTCRGKSGWPLLVKRSAFGGGFAAGVEVPDPGILPVPQTGEQLELHSRQLARPTVRVEIAQGTAFFDDRLSTLLHLVDELQSVRDACRTMQISYSVAWQMLNHAEDVTGFPLILRKRGGSAEHGSLLTEKGRRLLEAYDQFAARLTDVSQRLYGEHFENTLT